MAVFKIKAIKDQNKEIKEFIYDNQNSTLVDAETNQSVVQNIEVKRLFDNVPVVSKETPLGKKTPRTLKISLGLSCNYECEYCSQRFVPRADETNPDSVDNFINRLDSWVKQPPEKIEFWGGEPFVYIKTLKPLAERIKEKYPTADLSVITNGSLLNKEINEWLDNMGFFVAVSHDGPGQPVRGPDPLEDPEKKEAILDLYKRLHHKNRFSFNSMMNSYNPSREKIQNFFIELTGDKNITIGEGLFIDPYDEGGLSTSLPTESHMYAYRNLAFYEMRKGAMSNFTNVKQKTADFVNSIRVKRPAKMVGQKCGMDKEDNIAVDLNGNVITCQNVSHVSRAPNGESHKIGHISDFENIKLNTATHWSKRPECSNCPVLHICRGSCMFLEGNLWEVACNNAFSDSIPIFAAAIEFLTGYVPIHIEGPQREDRKDIWGMNVDREKAKKSIIPIIPIKQI